VALLAPASLCAPSCEGQGYDQGPDTITWTRSDEPRKQANRLRGPQNGGIVRYSVDLQHPMQGLPLRIGEVHYMQSGQSTNFERATLTLYANGFSVRLGEPQNGDGEAEELSIAWSPFSLVQACRLHSIKADLASPSLRLFKVSVFHHGSTHFFAVEGEDADLERTRWVADVSRALRLFTQSLFFPFSLSVEPVPGVIGTGTRILAGYLLKCEKQDVMLVYGELHAHQNSRAEFVLYEDESCANPLLPFGIEVETPVSEHVAVDCSCFTVDCQHFTARTSAEKALWLRAISNLKVKMRHVMENPTPEDLQAYRASISEYIRSLTPEEEDAPRQKPLLPKRRTERRPLMKAMGDCQSPQVTRTKSLENCDTATAINIPKRNPKGRKLTCLMGHELQLLSVGAGVGYCCKRCKAAIDDGAQLHRCNLCDYDLCLPCGTQAPAPHIVSLGE